MTKLPHLLSLLPNSFFGRLARRSFSVGVLFAIVLFSCEKPLPEFTGMDLKSWKEDKKGCSKVRAGMLTELESQRNKLQGLSEMQIIELLGRPDEYDLGKRHQKFFGYWLEPGASCGSAAAAKKLTIRFNATGAAKEIVIEL